MGEQRWRSQMMISQVRSKAKPDSETRSVGGKKRSYVDNLPGCSGENSKEIPKQTPGFIRPAENT